MSALGGSALFAPAAMAIQPKQPALLSSNPDSPSTASRPFLLGDADGVITSVVKHGLRLFGPVTHAVGPENPGFRIDIYAEDASCSEAAAIAATGTAAEFNETGLQVATPVKADWVTTFYARQTDPSDPLNPSTCSPGLKYQQVTTPPAPPTFSATNPASPANANLPHLTGTAVPNSEVSLYTTADCSGAPIGTGSAQEFATGGIEAPVEDDTTTVFHATADLAGLNSKCSTSTITYQEVTNGTPGGGGEEPPGGTGGGGGGNGGGTGEPEQRPADPPGKPDAPRLRTKPDGPANDNNPLVVAKAPGAATVKVFGSEGCKGPVLLEAPVGQLDDGVALQVGDNTTLTLYGVSIDGGGDRSPCSAEPAVYVEDSTAPHTRITAGPSARTRKRSVLFRFADTTNDPTTSFLCRLDHRKWRACKAPLKLKKLGHKKHLLRVKAEDAAGNLEVTVAKRRFQVIR